MRLLRYTALALAYYASSTTAADIPDTFRWIAADDNNDTNVSVSSSSIAIPTATVESPIMSEEETRKKVLLPTNPRTIRSKSGKPNVSSMSMSMSMPTKAETVTSSSKSAEITDASSTSTSTSSMSMSIPGSDGVGTKEKSPNSVGAPLALEKDGSGSESSSSSSVSTNDIKLDTKAQKISRLSTKSNKKQTIAVETEVEAETQKISSSSSSSSANTNSLLDSKAHKISHASSGSEIVADSIEQSTTTTATAEPTTSSSATAVATTTTTTAVPAKSTEAAMVPESIVSSTTTSTSTTTTTTSTTTSATTTSSTTTEEPIVLQVEDDNVEGEMNERLSIPILANDVYPESAEGFFSLPQHGELVEPTENGLIYMPDTDFCGDDSFAYNLTTIHGEEEDDDEVPLLSDSATVSIRIKCPQVLLDLEDDVNVEGTMNEELSIPIFLNDVYPESAEGSFPVLPQHGNLVRPTENGLIYLPNTDFCGDDSFVYSLTTIDDEGEEVSDLARVSIHILCDTSLEPSAMNDEISTVQDSEPVVVQVLANDVGYGNELHVKSILYDATNGHCDVLGGDDAVVYTPDIGFVGQDNCVYSTCNENGACDSAILTIDVVQPSLTVSLANSTEETQDDSNNSGFIIAGASVFVAVAAHLVKKKYEKERKYGSTKSSWLNRTSSDDHDTDDLSMASGDAWVISKEAQGMHMDQYPFGFKKRTDMSIAFGNSSANDGPKRNLSTIWSEGALTDNEGRLESSLHTEDNELMSPSASHPFSPTDSSLTAVSSAQSIEFVGEPLEL